MIPGALSIHPERWNLLACRLTFCCLFLSLLVLSAIALPHLLAEFETFGLSTPLLTQCAAIPDFPNQLKFSLEDTRNAGYIYKSLQADLEVRQMCPSLRLDTRIFVNGKLVGGTEKQYMHLLTRTYIRDCHGNALAKTESSNFGGTLLNIIRFLFTSDPRTKYLIPAEPGNDWTLRIEKFRPPVYLRFFFEKDYLQIYDKNANEVAYVHRKHSWYSHQPWDVELKAITEDNKFFVYSIIGKLIQEAHGAAQCNTGTIILEIFFILITISLFCFPCCLCWYFGCITCDCPCRREDELEARLLP